MRITLLLPLIAVIGCDRPVGRPPSTGGGPGDLDAGVAADGAVNNGSWDGFIRDMSSVDAAEEGCPPEATWIYTIDQDGVLSSFKPNAKDPASSVMTDIGKPDCMTNTRGGTAFSMSVDRTGTAWVEYHSFVSISGSPTTELFKVSTTNATCMPTTYMGPQNGIDWFGMGFSTDGPHSTSDTLFIAGGGGSGGSTLGTLDTNSLKLTTIHALSGNAELSGSGNGDLFAFLPDEMNAPRIVTLDKKTGAELKEIKLDKLKGKATSWAFGFWGGDFWIFLQRDGEKSSTLYHVNGKTGAVDSAPIKHSMPIVGAGVSTCAPPAPIP